jgi:hypothetical protein
MQQHGMQISKPPLGAHVTQHGSHESNGTAPYFCVGTGLGALLVRRDVLPLLSRHKAYWGGGTVAGAVAEEDWVARWVGRAGKGRKGWRHGALRTGSNSRASAPKRISHCPITGFAASQVLVCPVAEESMHQEHANRRLHPAQTQRL